MKIEKVIHMLTALAHDKRLRLWQLLVKSGEAGMAAGTISQRLKIPNTTASFHLKQLHQSGLIEQHRDKTSIIYRANRENMRQLLDFLELD